MDEPKRSGAGWLIVAGVTLLVLIGGGWALLSGMPFHKDQPRHETAPPLDTIAESSSPGSPETQIGEPAQATPVPARPRPAPPPPITATGGMVRGAVPPSVPSPSPPITAGAPSPAPSQATAAASPPAVPPRTPPSRRDTAGDAPPSLPPASSTAGSEGLISESDAVIHLRSFLARNDPYGVPLACLDVQSLGLRNRGYTLEVAQHPCDSSGDSRTLGRWRVDALTREIFRQRGDGRFLRP